MSREPQEPPKSLPRPVGGLLGYDGALYRPLTHLASAWLFGLPALLALRTLWRVRVDGREHVRALRPPLLVVSNHQSLIDSHVVCLALGLWPHGLLDTRIVPYHTPEARNFMASRLSRLLHLALRCVPVHRGQGVAQPAMDTVIALLRRGNTAYMFPEGTRTRAPATEASTVAAIGRATPGVGRVILQSGCSVLPAHISGMAEVFPVGASRPRRGPAIHITASPPLPAADFAHLADDRKGWQAAAELALEAVRRLAPPGVSKDGVIQPGDPGEVPVERE